jgi:hypothetical protein
VASVYLLLAGILGNLLVSKIQKDSTDAATRQKIADEIRVLAEKVDKAHIEAQTGVKQ